MASRWQRIFINLKTKVASLAGDQSFGVCGIKGNHDTVLPGTCRSYWDSRGKGASDNALACQYSLDDCQVDARVCMTRSMLGFI